MSAAKNTKVAAKKAPASRTAPTHPSWIDMVKVCIPPTLLFIPSSLGCFWAPSPLWIHAQGNSPAALSSETMILRPFHLTSLIRYPSLGMHR